MNTALKIAPEPMSLKNLLRTAAKPEEPAKKSATPILPVDEQVKGLATEVRKAKELADSSKTLFEMKSQELVDAIADLRGELCRRNYTSAVRIPTLDNLSVTIVWSGNYTKISGSKEADLVSIVGDKYPEYFQSKFAITVKDELSDDERTEFINRLGAEMFTKFCSVEEVIKPTERFKFDHVCMDRATREALEMATVKQFKASVRTR